MQAAQWAVRSSRSSGTTRRHSSTAMGQRGWKTHPAGGSTGLGTSPRRMIRWRSASTTGSGTGTAERSAWVDGGEEEIREPEPRLEIFEEVDDLRLDGDIEG